ncbi:YibE/F family protein [Serpentinicella sp. ANB-PHB4]|uniref:YibE/F family protein n=1 Tax=Serpentinicella sp. ANB-PHB4 TaxID=3074076 RepID=UPI00285C12DC|nr:YibE/F family protein [Serpentinicella sp. ANB-PHB4]MDR5659290.1 YibE/F family protein [Serpentinicella sp. ANB-PHB4]
MRKRIGLFLILTILMSLAMSYTAMGQDVDYEQVIEKAKVLSVQPTSGDTDLDILGSDFFQETMIVTVEILSGEYKGRQVETVHALTGDIGYDVPVEAGNNVLVAIDERGGNEIDAHIAEYAREGYIKIVLAIFVALLLIIGGLKGLKTLLTLALTVGLILKVLLPGLLAGYSPILLTVGISIVITVITITVVGGLNRKSLAAIIGVFCSVLVSGIIAYVVGTNARLTGLSSQEAMMLMYIPQEVEFNFNGLLFAGIIMGALGAIMDVGMSIASAIEEVRSANPTLTTKELVLSGMNVGKDIMGTMANTLILAYAGSTIPLLLLFTAYQESLMSIINMDLIATEIIRALAGSIGLVLCVPITAVLTGLLINKNKAKDKINADVE